MKHQTLYIWGVIPILLNVWVAPLGIFALPSPKSNDSKPLETGEFVWDSIAPSPELVFHQCYGAFECARLQVPLDYLAEDPDGAHAYIAIVKYTSDPVNYPEYSESWGGPILLNPGGPGGSGVEFVLELGPDLQNMAGSQFSIIGFDPRGVNYTLPAVSCFDTPYDRVLFEVRSGGRIAVGDELGEVFVRGKQIGNICTTGEKAKELQYLGTASVARDMRSINEAIWDLAPTDIGRKGLQYWGFSYGTALGITYATLFPDNVERMILDGVVDVIDYFSGGMKKDLTDTEAVMNSFYEFCFRAGPMKCQFYTGTKPEHIRERLNNVLEALRTQPLPYLIDSYSSGTGQTELFTYSHLRMTIFGALYSPLQTFEMLAEFLVLIESALEAQYLTTDPGTRPPLTCPLDEYSDSWNTALLTTEANIANYCGEVSFTNLTLADFRKILEGLREMSPTVGDLWATSILSCIDWTPQAREKPPKFVEAKETDTWEGAPILFTSTTSDPVCPFENAYSMAKLFPANASAIMVQEGEGHCSISVPSDCMIAAIQTYLATGKVPPENERNCSRPEAPFLGILSGKLKRSIAVENMRNVGLQIHRPRGFPQIRPGASPFGWAARLSGRNSPKGGW